MGFEALFSSPMLLLILVFGVFFGMIMGAIPGLTATLAVTMALPFTYTLSPNMGLTLLVAIYVGGIAGGLVAAILLNIPGSPMARKGESARALTLGVFASLIGGTFSAVALVIIAPKLAKVSLAFGAWEYFALGLLGLAIIISIVGAADMLKGLISAIYRDTRALVDNQTSIEAIQTGSTANLPFPALVEWADRAIAALYRGADLSTISKGDGTGASLQGDESGMLEQDAVANLGEALHEQVDRFVIRYVTGDEEPLAYISIEPVVKPDVDTSVIPK